MWANGLGSRLFDGDHKCLYLLVSGLVGGDVCLPGVRLITVAITARIVSGQGVSRNSSESVNVGRK